MNKMKKHIGMVLLAVGCLLMTQCKVAETAAVPEGSAYILVVAYDDFPITVTIDGNEYTATTVEQAYYKRQRNYKKIGNRRIVFPGGTHDVTITREGHVLYCKQIFVAADETKVIEL